MNLSTWSFYDQATLKHAASIIKVYLPIYFHQIFTSVLSEVGTVTRDHVRLLPLLLTEINNLSDQMKNSESL